MKGGKELIGKESGLPEGPGINSSFPVLTIYVQRVTCVHPLFQVLRRPLDPIIWQVDLFIRI